MAGRKWRRFPLPRPLAGRAAACRAGQDLVCRFVPLAEVDLVADLAVHVTGKLGRALAREGIQAAVVLPDGRVRAANTAFAARAGAKARGRQRFRLVVPRR
jgi:hypothetical protein